MIAAARVSFEFFPPQTLDASFRLWETVQTLAPLRPNLSRSPTARAARRAKLTHEAVSTIGTQLRAERRGAI